MMQYIQLKAISDMLAARDVEILSLRAELRDAADIFAYAIVSNGPRTSRAQAFMNKWSAKEDES